jgi:meiotically up-regulated gene 157 (Mug157) protein
MQPALFEGKYELDSLCAVLKLCSDIVNRTDYNVSFLRNNVGLWIDAMEKILTTMAAQQMSTDEQNGNYPYKFDRNDGGGRYDVYPRKPVRRTGLIRSAFRPSDDATLLDFLIPSNAMAIVSLYQLEHLCSLMSAAYPSYAERISTLVSLSVTVREEVQFGIQMAKVNGSHSVMAFEIDGFGNTTMMDDANVPSLLSLPFVGYDDGVNYQAVRAWVLSAANPWYFNGTAGRGIGSPHTGPGYIWPMSVTMQALTSTSDEEITECLSILLTSANNTGFMHESFFMDDPAIFTRHWFAWANTLFGGLIVYLAENKPHLIF